MIHPATCILAAVSGGPDSVALLTCLMKHRDDLKLDKIGVAHVNHMIRGEAADKDEQFVRELARDFDLSFYCSRTDVKSFAEKNKMSIEDAGRVIRYQFLSEIRSNKNYDFISTGHTKDDNAEQVLMNLIRGSGLKGLSGIPPKRNDRVIRPLIRCSKKEILCFLDGNHINYRIDETNMDPVFLRNRIRHELMPVLQSGFNPSIIDALDRLTRVLSLDEAFLAEQTQQAFDVCLAQSDPQKIVFSRQALIALHPALQRRVFREAVKTLKHDLQRISHTHTELILNFCAASSSGKSLDLPGQIRIYKSKQHITVKKETTGLRQIGKGVKTEP